MLSELPPQVEPALLDVATLEVGPYFVSGTSLRIGVGGQEVALAAPTRGWIRRLAPPQWRLGVAGGSRDGAVRGAWLALLTGLIAEPTVAWLTAYEQLFTSENKLIQARCATRLGVRTPRTVAARNSADIPDEFGERVVVKPLGTSHYTTEGGDAFVLWAQSLARGDERLGYLDGAPFLVQEELHALRHLRVVTVRDRAWACELDATDLPLDWRSSDEAHHAFRATTEPLVEVDAVRLARALQLGYSSQDWIDTGDGLAFVDLNPAGQWLFLPEPVRGDVARAIAGHLTGEEH
ncbi:MAG: hypothetical protein M3P44_16000 [Actinomycetota bacterium]|nr:hypothetical protein [Actinomycetota bacterium]